MDVILHKSFTSAVQTDVKFCIVFVSRAQMSATIHAHPNCRALGHQHIHLRPYVMPNGRLPPIIVHKTMHPNRVLLSLES